MGLFTQPGATPPAKYHNIQSFTLFHQITIGEIPIKSCFNTATDFLYQDVIIDRGE